MDRGQGMPDSLSEQLFLAGEVEVDRALGYSCTAGNLVEGGARDPGFAEDLECCVEDLAGAVGGLSPPFGAFRYRYSY